MGNISNYARVLKAKLQDVFVIDSTDNNVTSTKSVTVEQIGDAICGEQVHATLETDDKTIIGGINENKDKVGSLSQLTTSDKSSLVGAVNEVNNQLGNRLVGAWTADTSTGNLQLLTDYIDVEAGTYLVTMAYPDTSANFVAGLYSQAKSGVYDNCFMSGGSWATKVIVTAFSSNTKICIASAQGATCNFTNKNRGSIRAIKLSNVYKLK